MPVLGVGNMIRIGEEFHDTRVALDVGINRVPGINLAKSFRQGQVRTRAEVLIPKEQHLVLYQSGVQSVGSWCVQGLRQVYTGDLGAQGGGDRVELQEGSPAEPMLPLL